MNVARLSLFFMLAIANPVRGDGLTPDQIVKRTLEFDSLGNGDTETVSHAVVKDARGATRQINFASKSKRYAPLLNKSIVRFSAPADLNGVGFLQIEKQDNDDDRYLYLPELHRSRRIAGNARSSAFVGTDFSYADLDRRDIRESSAVSKGDETIAGKFPCYHLEITPRAPDAVYARIEMWTRKDNFVPLKALMYNKANVLLKTLEAKEVRRISGRWYITRSVMTSHQDGRSTELVIDKITPTQGLGDDLFTVRSLENG